MTDDDAAGTVETASLRRSSSLEMTTRPKTTSRYGWSLRRRVTVVFLLVNLGMLGLLVYYIFRETMLLRARFDEDRGNLERQVTKLLPLEFLDSLDRLEQGLQLSLAQADFRNTMGPAIDISNMSLWDDDGFVREHLDKAVLVSYTGIDTALFNLRRALIFEAGSIDKRSVRERVESAERITYSQDLQGRTIVCGRIAPNLGASSGFAANWGYYFRLKQVRPSLVEPVRWVSTVLWLTLPATVFLLGFLYFFFSRSVLRPLSELETAARRASRGDYGTLVAYDRRDELGRVALSMNLMMTELARYREHMEGLVGEATERFKRAERHLVVAQRLAAMGYLAAGVAHEINNPVGGILNALQKLAQPDLDPAKRVRYSELAEDAVRRIQSTVQRMLQATPRGGQRVAPVLMREVLDHAAGLVQHRLRKKSIAFEATVPEDLRALGDRNELVQVFLNLFINACDAVAEQGRIRVTAAATPDRQVEVRVADDGMGIDPEIRPHIFDLFFTTKPGTEGTGLGLGIVHNIVTGHGGTITVADNTGGGTVFVVTLPSSTDEDESLPETLPGHPG